ncbi:phosphate butyryltransferase [Pontibacillus halophilus JSM 076056 = DSM 19796]|uniref:Phosphate butyryltransferase n=1 Tax=Pontibacillus halophilus JSM 076056 = DSM 19796 TaxID=1385510 RepID=A0A0A5GFZ1_9BACI|nr:phosphate butyryltransferase [Pontibacillus halophilus]KGX90929.1 phosphate butyryltransferase [Pontibacillus halophilus JSM 076056 = DSM 19796]
MKLSSLLQQVKEGSKRTVAVAQAADIEVLKSVKLALHESVAHFILVGDEKGIVEAAQDAGLSLESDSVSIASSSYETSAETAVQLVSKGEADVVMKGNIDTKTVLKAVLNKEYGLRTGNVLSHVAVFEVPGRDRFTLLTDSGMNIEPTVEEKAQIIRNSVRVAKSIGIEEPKVAALAAVEVVNPTMQATVDAASLAVMQRRGQITDCIVDGPLAFDVAVSEEAVAHKGVVSPVAGQADILLAPTIEVANALYKSFVYFAGANVAGLISGAKAPIVLTSRADSAESKLYSLALALLTSERD